MNQNKELLTKTLDDYLFASNNLRELLAKTGIMESMIILPMIEKTNQLINETRTLLMAISEKEPKE